MYKELFKRYIDFLIAFGALIILAPIILVLGVVLSFFNKGTPFFFQVRPGIHGKLFKIVKFKTMNDKRGEDGILLPGPERITWIGDLIRKTSLDEIPQLWNVLVGDMSLVGPRPLLPQYLPLYSREQYRRHEVRPGITGWAQVKGRNTLSWEQKFEYDVWYVDHCSFALDLKILYLTFLKVVKREGVNAQENITMEPFKGNK